MLVSMAMPQLVVVITNRVVTMSIKVIEFIGAIKFIMAQQQWNSW